MFVCKNKNQNWKTHTHSKKNTNTSKKIVTYLWKSNCDFYSKSMNLQTNILQRSILLPLYIYVLNFAKFWENCFFMLSWRSVHSSKCAMNSHTPTSIVKNEGDQLILTKSSQITMTEHSKVANISGGKNVISIWEIDQLMISISCYQTRVVILFCFCGQLSFRDKSGSNVRLQLLHDICILISYVVLDNFLNFRWNWIMSPCVSLIIQCHNAVWKNVMERARRGLTKEAIAGIF